MTTVKVRNEHPRYWSAPWYTCRLVLSPDNSIRCDVDHRSLGAAEAHAKRLQLGCYVVRAFRSGYPPIHDRCCATKGDAAKLRRRFEDQGFLVAVEEVRSQ